MWQSDKKRFITGGLTCQALLVVCILLLAPPALTAKEKTIYRIGLPEDKAPFAFVSLSKDGVKLRGAYIDVMSQIAHHMGAEFRYVRGKTPAKRLQLLHDKKVDMLGLTLEHVFPENTDLQNIPVGLHLTSWLFVHQQCKTIVCSRDLPGKKVGIIGHKDFGAWPYDHSGISDITVVPSPLKGLTMLDKGFLHAFIAPSEEIASYIIQKKGLVHIRRVGMPLRMVPLCVSIAKGNTRFEGKLRRAIRKTQASGIIHQIEDKWYGVEFKRSFFDKYRRVLFSIIGVTILILGFVITWNRQLKKQVAKMTSRYRASERRYRNLIESSADMMFVVNRQAKICSMNREAMFMLPNVGQTENGRPDLMDIVLPADKPLMSTFLDTVFTSTRAVREFRFKARQVGYLEIDISATLLPSEPGEEPNACLFARDVTQRNRIERELVQADRMAIIGQMAADVAHEINNPIGIVRANIDVILARGWFTPEAREFLESCKRNTVRAGKFTKDLLAMARPKEPEMTTLDLWELMDTTIGIMGAQLKNITITKHTRGIPARILGDRNLLQQVLVNLFLNAAGAMEHTPAPHITITCCVPKGADMARLRVEDTGMGIPRQHLHEIFEPFFTRGKKEGFGLGLFISKRIIEKHNGVIYVESEVDAGTQFIIEIPLETGNTCLPAPAVDIPDDGK